MNDPKTYTAAQIERYHSGLLSAAERHALEKAALDDPFLADALEGYAAAKAPSADLAILQQRLQLRMEKEKGRRGVVYLNNWMKIAAMLLLMAGGGWMVLQLFNGDRPTMALKQEAPKSLPSAPTQSVADSTTFTPGAPLTTQAPPVESEKAEVSDKAMRNNTTAQKAPLQKANDAPAAALVIPVPDSVKEKSGEGSLTGALQGRAAGIAVKKPADNAAELNEIRVEETNFKKYSPAAAAKSNVYTASKDTIKNFNVTLRHTDLPADQTVVLKGKAKEAPEAKRLNVKLDSLEPAEGWTRFDDYVSSNIKEPEEIKTKQVSGEVELSFDVNKEGEAINITVTKSLCDKCDEEAVRLLKEGPKWKKNKKKGKVKIKFPIVP